MKRLHLRQRKDSDTLHVRLVKDNYLKIKKIMETQNLSQKAAKDFIDREEGDLRAYIKHYFKRIGTLHTSMISSLIWGKPRLKKPLI